MSLQPLQAESCPAAAGRDRARLFDVLRGLLASWVVLHHVVLIGGFDAGVYPWRLLARHGQEAVLVFFMLSGFAIAQSLRGRRQRWPAFLLARIWRIYPVYLVALTLGLGICWYAEQHAELFLQLRRLHVEAWAADEAAPAWLQVGLHLTQLHGVVPATWLPHADISLVAPGWSLSTEFQFYLIAPLLCLLLLERPAALCLTLGATIIALGIGSDLLAGAAIAPASVLRYLDLFVLGMLGAIGWQRRWLFRVGYTLLALAVGAAGWSSGHVIVANAVSVWLLFWWGSLLPPLERGLDTGAGRIAMYLGAVSFPLYIIHYPLARLLLLGAAAWPLSRPAFLLLWVPATIALSYVAAGLLHSWAEQPGTRHGKRLAARWELRAAAWSRGGA